MYGKFVVYVLEKESSGGMKRVVAISVSPSTRDLSQSANPSIAMS